MAGHADVEVAVGREDHAVDAAALEVLARGGVGELDAGRAVGRTAGVKAGDGAVDVGLAITRCRRQDQAAVARVDDNRHAVLAAKRVGQHPHRRLDQWELVLRLHRPGHVEQEHQIARGRFRSRQRAALQPDQRQVVGRIPRARRQLGRHREWLACRCLAVVEPEVVDQLLDADGIERREVAVGEEPAHVGIRRRVHVDGERGQRVRGHSAKRVLGDRRVAFTGSSRAGPAREVAANTVCGAASYPAGDPTDHASRLAGRVTASGRSGHGNRLGQGRHFDRR